MCKINYEKDVELFDDFGTSFNVIINYIVHVQL